MKKKFFFRPKSLSELPLLVKVDVNRDEADVFEDDGSELTVEEIEEKAAEIERLLNPPKPMPAKPPKQKVKKYDVISGVVLFDRWSPIVKRWAKENSLDNDVVTEFEKESDRIDIVHASWRLCIIGQCNEEFTITLYYDYETRYSSRAIEIRYINVNEIHKSLDYVFAGMKLFIKKES